MNTRFDIVVVGGGIVGLTFALLLKDTGLKIALVDKAALPTTLSDARPGRVSSINRGTEKCFIELGAWHAMQAMGVSPYQTMRVWESRTGGELSFAATEIGQPNLGYIIENEVIRLALLEQIQTQENITVHDRQSFTGISECDGILCCQGAHPFEMRLLVAADGANSWVRNELGFTLKTYDYGHHALVGTVQTELPHGAVATQRFLPEGPLAFLPLRDPHMSSIVWSSSPQHIEALQQSSQSLLGKKLTEAFESCLGEVRVVGSVQSFPLKMRHVHHYVREQVALIGDAAHTIHPLAGQGLNLGVQDAKALADSVKQALNKDRDYATIDVLRRYERGRKEANLKMILAMEGIKQLFGSQLPGLAWARNQGLALVSGMKGLKKQLAHVALGIS